MLGIRRLDLKSRVLRLEALEPRQVLAADAGTTTDIAVEGAPPIVIQSGPDAGNVRYPVSMVEVNGEVVVRTLDGLFNVGTAGERADLIGVFLPTYTLELDPVHLAVFHDEVYLDYTDRDGVLQLWRTNNGGGFATRIPLPDAPVAAKMIDSAVLGDALYFITDTLTTRALWRTDGSDAGTYKVVDLEKHLVDYGGYYEADQPHLTTVNGVLLFQGFDRDHGSELWRSDGTAAGTRLLADLNPATMSLGVLGDLNEDGKVNLFDFGLFKEHFGWRAGSGEAVPFALREFTEDGDIDLEDFGLFKASFGNPVERRAGHGSSPGAMFVRGDQAYFFASDAVHGAELWVTDGAEAGTHLAVDIRPGIYPSVSTPYPPIVARGDEMVFFADDGVQGRQVWQSDGTPQGTRMLTTTLPQTPADLEHSSLVVWRDFVFFSALADPLRNDKFAIWRTDGTPEGTLALTSLFKTNNSTAPQLSAAGDRVFITDRYFTERIWQTDGTAEGTHPAETTARAFRVLGWSQTLFFQQGDFLWRTDGTEAGTKVTGR